MTVTIPAVNRREIAVSIFSAALTRQVPERTIGLALIAELERKYKFRPPLAEVPPMPLRKEGE